jgi:hypothetical protein
MPTSAMHGELISTLQLLPAMKARLKTCPLDEVIDLRLDIIATLITARDLAGNIADAMTDDTQVKCFWLIEAKLNDYILRWTEVNSVAATVGR